MEAMEMVDAIESFLDDRLMTAVALIVMICMKRSGGTGSMMLFVPFAYFLKVKDVKAVDLTSKRQVS